MVNYCFKSDHWLSCFVLGPCCYNPCQGYAGTWDCNLSDDNDHDDHYGEEEFETQFDGIKVKLSSPV